jgi:hypothetical protein
MEMHRQRWALTLLLLMGCFVGVAVAGWPSGGADAPLRVTGNTEVGVTTTTRRTLTTSTLATLSVDPSLLTVPEVATTTAPRSGSRSPARPAVPRPVATTAPPTTAPPTTAPPSSAPPSSTVTTLVGGDTHF